MCVSVNVLVVNYEHIFKAFWSIVKIVDTESHVIITVVVDVAYVVIAVLLGVVLVCDCLLMWLLSLVFGCYVILFGF